MTVTANSTINFWGDLATQIKAMLSTNGTVTINSLAGAIIVTDTHRNLETVSQFLSSVTESVVRQIDLEVQIYEVAFSNSRQLGIDRTRIGQMLDPNAVRDLGTEFSTSLVIRNPVYGPAMPASTVTIGQDFEKHITGVLEALEQQGDLKVVSKPRLRTLNNQPAVVRVGQDLPVFTKQVTQSPGTPPVITTTESIQTITVGTVLSITPQVSANGLITLDISPAVSRLVRTATSASGETSAPVIDIRQASSIVRLRDGDTVVMGGLVQDSTATTHRKIPLLGDIPLLGKAFSGESLSTERTELVFFLTPRIVRDSGAK
jgi:MSHA type pilus biogenesis protein MshL